MFKSIFVTLSIYILISFIIPLPLGFSLLPVVGWVPRALIIAITVGVIEYFYRLSISSRNWKTWDSLAILIIFLTMTYGFLNIDQHRVLFSVFSIVSIFVFVTVKILHFYLLKHSLNKRINYTRAYRNQFAISILISFMFIPTSLILPILQEEPVSQEVISPFTYTMERESMIEDYLLAKYPDITSVDQWSNQKMVAFLQDIEYIEANTAHRKFATVELADELQFSDALYDPRINTIKVNTKLIESKSLRDLIAILLHESRHVYQVQLLSQVNWKDPIVKNSPEFTQLNKMYESLRYYKDGFQVEYEEYYNQLVEVDARQFSENVLPIYERLLSFP